MKRSETYSANRKFFEDGDLILFKGKSRLSTLIRWFTKSPYSHAGIIANITIDNAHRVIVLEAVGTGLRVYPLSELIKKYIGGIDHYKICSTHSYNGSKAVKYMWKRIGTVYSKKQLLKFVWIKILNKVFKLNLEVTDVDKKALICSEAAGNAICRGLSIKNSKIYSPAELAIASFTQLFKEYK